MTARAALLAAGLVLLSCGVRAPERSRAPAEVEPAAAVDLPRRSCRSSASTTQAMLSNVRRPVRIGERTFTYARRASATGVDTVIVSIDARGALVLSPIPVPYADPTSIGADDGGLVVVSVPLRGTGTLVRVSLGADGSLQAGPAVALPEIGWGWPGTIVSDGSRATLEHALATPEQTIGGRVVYTIDLIAQRVIGTAALAPSSSCGGGACSSIEVTRSPSRASFVHRTQDGTEERLELALGSTCPALYEIASGADRILVAPGDPWRAVRIAPAPPHLREVPIDPALTPVPGCGSVLYDFPSETRPGVVDGYRGPRRLLRFDAERGTFGAVEPLPELAFDRGGRFGHPDGVIEVAWNGGSGLQHSPTDEGGRRRYYEHWFFDGGTVSLLRYERGRWAALDGTPLALESARGTFHEGYEAIVLRNGVYAAVLLAPQGGTEPAYLQPYLAPCASD